jgi:hypothetical protein
MFHTFLGAYNGLVCGFILIEQAGKMGVAGFKRMNQGLIFWEFACERMVVDMHDEPV